MCRIAAFSPSNVLLMRTLPRVAGWLRRGLQPGHVENFGGELLDDGRAQHAGASRAGPDHDGFVDNIEDAIHHQADVALVLTADHYLQGFAHGGRYGLASAA